MDERNYSINWLGLFIKVTVFVVVVLFAIWLVSKIVRRDKGLSFEENNKLFKEASVEYFSKHLPEEGETNTVTLKQLIAWDYIDELKNEDGKTCDTKNSKSKIELIEDYYSIKTELICGKQSETNYIKIGNEKCTNCDVKVEGLEIKKEKQQEETKSNKEEEIATHGGSKGTISNQNNTNNVNNNTSNNIQNDTSNQTILYEYVKEVNNYSNWYTGKVTGDNIENSTKKVSYSKYCKRTNLRDCLTDKTENSNNYNNYKIVDTWNETIDIYRYKITVSEYLYSNREYVEGYTKTGKTKIAS